MLTLTAAVGETRQVSNLGEVIEIKVLGVTGNRVLFGVVTHATTAATVEVPTDIAFLRKQAD
jgi:sRNA-binding carbon storage regulator CsrA